MITRLRQKIENDPKNPKYLQTIRGTDMLSGLTRVIKIILPKGYLIFNNSSCPNYNFAVDSFYSFFDSIWISNKGMTRSLVSEIKTLVDVYNQSDKNQINYITSIYKNYDYVINILEKEILDDSFERKFSPMDRSLRRELKSTFGSENYWFSTTSYLDIVEVKIRSDDKILQFLFPKEKIARPSVRLFILWLTVPSLILILIAILFLKTKQSQL